MRKSSARQPVARSDGGQAGRQIGGPKMLAKPVRVASYKEMRIHFIRNDISIKKLGEEFEMGAGASAEFSKVTI